MDLQLANCKSIEFFVDWNILIKFAYGIIYAL